MGKTSQTEQKVKLAPEIKAQALANLELAKRVGQLPYAPNFGLQVAGFSPQQQAGFGSTQDAASAFGLPSAGGTGLPPPQRAGGFSGYSTEGLYNNAMGQIPPSVLAMYNAFFGPQAGKGGASQPTGGGGGGGGGGGQVSRFSPSSGGKGVGQL